MKRVFLDTNFAMDYFIREQYHDQAAAVLRIGIYTNTEFCLSFLSVANFAYIMRKNTKDQLYLMLDRLASVFTITDNNKRQLFKAIEMESSDFEDALQYQTAMDNVCGCIITRNKKDFGFSAIPVLTPDEYVALNGCYECIDPGTI